MVVARDEPGAAARRSAGLSEDAWRGLLDFLARAGGDGAAAYEDLHGRLRFFFEWKGCAGAPELADETLNRVAAKLAAGEQIHTAEPGRFVFGVARFVHLEAVRRAAAAANGARAAAELPEREDAAQRDARFAALEVCLDALPPRTRQLMLAYHADDGRDRIDHRKRLADELGIALNALRIRVHRLRAQLEACLRARLDGRKPA